MKQSDYHECQSKACRALAANHPEHTLHWSVYMVQSQNHNRIAKDFCALEGQQEYINMIEDAIRKKNYENEIAEYERMHPPIAPQ